MESRYRILSEISVVSMLYIAMEILVSKSRTDEDHCATYREFHKFNSFKILGWRPNQNDIVEQEL